MSPGFQSQTARHLVPPTIVNLPRTRFPLPAPCTAAHLLGIQIFLLQAFSVAQEKHFPQPAGREGSLHYSYGTQKWESAWYNSKQNSDLLRTLVCYFWL